MKLSAESIRNREFWGNAQVKLPSFDHSALCKASAAAPRWLHFGSGSLFRAFHAMAAQALIEQGLMDCGVYVAETFDYEIVDVSYTPYDNLGIAVTLLPNGSLEKTLIASVAGALRADAAYQNDYETLKGIFRAPSLQLVSFTITEKGYALTDAAGAFTRLAQADFKAGPHKGASAMSKVASLLLERFEAGGAPLALVSTDNCSHNGEKLREGVLGMAQKWLEAGMVSQDFISWLQNEETVSFPWTMIDKITPRPAESVKAALEEQGIEGMDISVTAKGSYTAAFVNAEKPQYLVIEDRFPNGRPPLEAAGIYLADRDTVNAVERMKVTTCLNPLHTALAVFGCLLGYESIAAEMNDAQLSALVRRIGYDEGMPVVTDPGIISPESFIREVIEERLPNPFLPDTPQRIACDTSQKVPIRFGETIKAYAARSNLDTASLQFIPLAIAGWLRYLLALDDKGNAISCSPDPMLGYLQEQLEGIELGQPESAAGKLTGILSNPVFFAANLVELGLAPKIEGFFKEMLAGPGAVRNTLEKYVTSENGNTA